MHEQTTNEEVVVRLQGAAKRYGDTHAVRTTNLEIRKGELFTLLGPSGSGKTTILRMIAGLVTPSSGRVYINGKEVGDTQPHERNVGVVFQSLALFPHMNVFDNVAFPLKMRRIAKSEIEARVTSALDAVQLPKMSKRGAEELSGGQQQRVAIARALVYRPDLLLLDEPFAALDRRLREELQLEIVRLHNELDVTIINVTHDQREALMLSDRIGVMRDGEFEQIGSGETLYSRPATPFVAGFLGDANILSGIWMTHSTTPEIALDDKIAVRAPQPLHGHPKIGEKVSLVLRAEMLDLSPPGAPLENDVNTLDAHVTLAAFEGHARYYEVTTTGARPTVLKVVIQARQATQRFNVNDPVTLSWKPQDSTVLAGV